MFRNPSTEQRQSSQSVEKIFDALPSQAPQRTAAGYFLIFISADLRLLTQVEVRQMILLADRSALGWLSWSRRSSAVKCCLLYSAPQIGLAHGRPCFHVNNRMWSCFSGTGVPAVGNYSSSTNNIVLFKHATHCCGSNFDCVTHYVRSTLQIFTVRLYDWTQPICTR